jgi:hypothetical protein
MLEINARLSNFDKKGGKKEKEKTQPREVPFLKPRQSPICFHFLHKT